MYFITTKRMLEVCFFQHTPTFIIEPKKSLSVKERSAPKQEFVKTNQMHILTMRITFHNMKR